jgi:hypothetical protein
VISLADISQNHDGDAKKTRFRSKHLLKPSRSNVFAQQCKRNGASRGEERVKVRIWLIALLLMCQPAMAGQRILLIRGLMDYIPGISPMSLLKARLANEGYDVTMITHLNDELYKNQYWDAVIGHSQGAIDALRDAPDLARYNPRVTIITVDPPRTSVLFHCVRGVRYFDLHTGEFGLGGGSLSCPQAQNLAMGGLHVTLPMRSDTQEQILAYLRQDTPIEMAYAEPTHVSLPPIKPKQLVQPIKPKLTLQPINPKTEPPKVDDDTSFDARFSAVWSGATNALGPPVIPWTERRYAGVLEPN